MPLRQFRAAVRRPSFLHYGQWPALPRQIGLGHFAAALAQLQRSLDQGRNFAESEPSVDKFAHRDLVCRIQNRRCGASGRQSPAGDRQSRETRHIGFLEGQGRHPGQIEPRRRGRHAHRPSQAVRYRDSHVRGAQLSNHRSIAEFHQAMDDGLRMDDDVQLIGFQREQMLRLDQFQAFVH